MVIDHGHTDEADLRAAAAISSRPKGFSDIIQRHHQSVQMNSVRLLGTSTSLVKVAVVAVAGRCVKERVAEQAVRASKRLNR